MKRFVLQVFGFVFCAMVVYTLMLFVWVNFASNPMMKNFVVAPKGLIAHKMQEFEKIKTIDAVVLGSSCAYRGYDPRIFRQSGIEIFNFGSSSQTPLQTNFVVDNYVSKLNPKLVVFDILPYQFEESGLESNLDFMVNGILISTIDFKSKNMKVYNTYLYATIFKNFLNKKETNRDFNGTYIAGGYVQNLKIFKPYKSDTLKSISIKILPQQIAAFEQSINKIKVRHIPFVLVQSPIPLSTYKARRNNVEIDSLFATYGPYYNFNTMLTLPDSCFYDAVHLNQNGVNIFNKKLIEMITSSHLPAHF
jgi:hypothetical protein